VGMNFGQAGLTFTGKDVSLQKSVDSISDSFNTLMGKVGKMADSSLGLGRKIQSGLGGALGRGRQMLGGFGSALDSMAQKALNPKIDSAFASMHATFNKSFGEITVGMKMSGKESSKWRRVIGSNAFALNADMAQTATHWSEFRKQGLDLTKVLGGKGLAGGIRYLIKFTSLFGVEGKQMALLASGLVKGFGFTQEQVKGLTADVFAMGKAFNVGREAIQQLPGIMKVLNEEMADFLKGATPKDIEAYTKSIIKMGIGFKEGLGTSMEDGTELAKNLFKTLMTERKNLIDKFRGMGDASLSPFIKILSEAKGPGAAFSAIMKDLPGFMGALHKTMKKAESSGGQMGITYQRLSGSLNKVIGPDATYLAKGNWAKAEGAMSSLDKIAMQTQGNILALTKAVNKSYKSGRTAGDSFTIMLQAQEARIKTLTRPLLNKWIKDQKKGFDKFYKGLKKVADKKGPLGELTKRLLLVHDVGISGMFTGMNGMMPMMAKTMTTMGPMLAAFAHMGMSLALIGKLLLPGGIILIGLAMFNKNIREKLLGGLKKAWEWISAKVPEYWPKLKKGIIALWGKAIEGVKWAMDVVSPMLVRLAQAIEKVDWGGLVMKVVGFLGRFFRSVFDAIFGTGGALDPDTSTAEGRFMAAGYRLFGAIGKGMLSAGVAVLQQVWNFFFDWSDGFKEGLASKGRLIGGVFVAALFFGGTRKLMIQGITGIISLVFRFLIAPILAIMGQFFAGMLARQGTYLAVSMGMEKASFAKRAGMAITYYVKQPLFAAAYYSKMAILAAGHYAKELALSAGHYAKVAAFAIGRFIAIQAAHLVMAVKMAAQWLLSLGPIGLLIAAMVAVGAAIGALIDNWGDVKEAALNTWDKITGKTMVSLDLASSASWKATSKQIEDAQRQENAALRLRQAEASYAQAAAESSSSSMVQAANIQIGAAEGAANKQASAQTDASGQVTMAIKSSAQSGSMAYMALGKSAIGSAITQIKAAKLVAQATHKNAEAIQTMADKLRAVQEMKAGTAIAVVDLKHELSGKTAAQKKAFRAAETKLRIDYMSLLGEMKVTGTLRQAMINKLNMGIADTFAEEKTIKGARGRFDKLIESMRRSTAQQQAGKAAQRLFKESGTQYSFDAGEYNSLVKRIQEKILEGGFKGRDISQIPVSELLAEKRKAKTAKKITLGKIGKTKIRKGAVGAGVAGLGTGAATAVEKREVVERTLSADTKAAMVDVGLQMKELAQSISDLSDFKIVITGDVGRFLSAVKTRLGRNVGINNPTLYD